MTSKKILSILLLSTLAYSVHSQFTDNFSDGNFTSNPVWSGQDSLFTVNGSQELQLNDVAPVNPNAYLTTPSQAIENAQWDFYVKLDFNPSSANFSRVYLVSNSTNLMGSLNGYYVQIGSSDDDICLYKQSGTTRTKIIDGVNGLLNTTMADATVRVTRDASGSWELLADTLFGTNYVSLGTVFDNTYIQSLYVGVVANYTATRNTHFYYDNFVVTGTPFSDPTPPVISSVTVNGSNGLDVLFSEPVDPATATTLTNYVLSNGFGNPISANVNGGNNALVNLLFASNFPPQSFYTFFIENVEDFAANVMADTTISVSLYNASAYDLIINEIMAAPDAPQSPSDLPNEEYVELFNRTSFPISLNNWKLRIGGSVKNITGITIQPDSFMVITDNALSGTFPYTLAQTTIGTSSLGLTNSGASVELLDPANNVIDRVDYDLSYYNNTILDDGGYAMERVNPNEVCVGSTNWRATLELIGGTPGKKNFWYSTNATAFSFTVEEVVNVSTVDIRFSKFLDASSLQTSDFVIDQGIGSRDSMVQQSPGVYRLYLPNALQVNQSYYLTCVDTVRDCGGNMLTIGTQRELIFYIPSVFDLVINEMMIDPTPVVMLTADEYVEIYNRTPYSLNLKNWTLQTASNTYTLPSCIIQPDSFLVVGNLNVQFANPGINAIGLGTDVSMTNDAGTLALVSPNGLVVHYLNYSTAWYNNSAKAGGGWSLEQKDPTLPCLGQLNWSSSNDSTGGTPGRANSIFQSLTDTVAPVMLRAGFAPNDTLLIYFTEPLQPNTFQPVDFTIDNGIGNPLSVEVVAPEYKVARLMLGQTLAPGVIYTVSMTGNASDCAGNTADTATVSFGLPEIPVAGDLLINEVLFDPKGSGVDYVEIYNISSKPIDLRSFRIASADTVTNLLESIRILSNSPALIMPGEYTVLSTSAETVLTQYTTENRRAFWDVVSMPSYSNSYGVVVLCTPSQTDIDG